MIRLNTYKDCADRTWFGKPFQQLVRLLLNSAAVVELWLATDDVPGHCVMLLYGMCGSQCLHPGSHPGTVSPAAACASPAQTWWRR